jgi:pimeloyl-ACP methyl ester carboxylesterase
MFYNAKSGNIKIENTDMDYISFGKGKKNLVMIPGLGDGLKTVKGSAIIMAIMYKLYAKDYTVYVFSRKNQLEEGYSTKDMARDQKIAMEKLGITKANFFGVSHGGMISQYIAIDYPELVEKLILAVTLSKQNETVQQTVSNWIDMAAKNDYKSLFIDTSEKTYSEKYLRKYRPFYFILGSIGKPNNFNRFIIQAKSCINHNTYNELEKINCPTLIVGGDNDLIVGKNTSEEIAGKIKNSKLIIYKGLGHGTYTEAKDFNHQVIEFLKKEE